MRAVHIALSAALMCSSCVPLNPSARDMTGLWRIECEGGTETLDLRADGRYTYTIDEPSRKMKVDGTWMVEPARERLDGGHVVLRKAPQTCENAQGSPTLIVDNSLTTVWEWGRTELSYHPDLGGFRRVRK